MTDIILVRTRTTDPFPAELQQATSWWSRVESLGQVMLWDPPAGSGDHGYPVAAAWDEVVEAATKSDARCIVLVDSDQVFLSPQIARKGLDACPASWGYFTQWEHCRLPVGIGVRAFSAKNGIVRAWKGGPDELVGHFQAHPEGAGIVYEREAYVSYEDSLMDSRYRPELRDEYAGASDGLTPSLEGYLDWVKDNECRRIRYSPGHAPSGPVDERHMRAAYGFESHECADFPTYIMFDITNVCNARCSHCPHSRPDYTKEHPPASLDYAVFRKVIDECVGRPITFIRITADGEPLLHKGLADMLRYAAEKGVGPVGLTTNGALMTEDAATELLESGLFMVDFSLDAARRDTYEEIRKGLPFEKVVRNVETFVAARDKLNVPTKVMVSFVKQHKNEEELQEFKDKWEPIVDQVLVRELISNINLVDAENGGEEKERDRWPCPHFFRRIVINYDGTIKACPVDWDNRTRYLNACDTSIFDTWHSDFYRRMRMEHLNNVFTEGSACAECRDWIGTPWNLGYEKVVEAMTD